MSPKTVLQQCLKACEERLELIDAELAALRTTAAVAEGRRTDTERELARFLQAIRLLEQEGL
jgi:hypothetical protein